jgi:tol-pal system protein YbgF
MMRRFTFLLAPRCLPACLLVGLLAAGCSGNNLNGDDAREQEIQALKARILQLQQEAAMNQVEVAQLRQKVAELDTRGGGPRPSGPPASRTAPAQPPVVRPVAPPPSPALRPAPAAPVASVAPPASAPVRREPIPAVAEPANQPIEVVDIDLPATGPQPPRPAPPKTTAPVQAPKPSAPVAPAPSIAVKPAPTAPAPPVQGDIPLAGDGAVPASQALYDRGYSLFYQGHFVDAETSFQRFLQANPKSDLADNAQYWIGECRYSRNDVKGALAAFRQVVEKYPKGNKVADAMLKTGQCLEAMGDVEGARVTYREVIRRYSGSAAATAAEERRAKLP